MGNLISAVGNHPAKALTLLAMKDGNIYSSKDLQAALLSHQGGRIGWSMGHGRAFYYCEKSLAPIGLVTKEVLNSDLSTYGYQITDYGRNIGLPFCGLILNWSAKHDINLGLFWGQTSSPSPSKTTEKTINQAVELRKRAPSTTLKVLDKVIAAPDLPLTEGGLNQRIDERKEGATSKHLRRLARIGLIEYHAIEINRPYSAYKLALSRSPKALPIYGTQRSLTQTVFAVLQQNPDSYLTIKQVLSLLPQLPEGLRPKDSYLYVTVSAILAHFTKAGYAEVKRFHKGSYSEISVNNDQRIILTELLETIDRFRDQDPGVVTKGRHLAETIISNPTRVSDILRKAREESAHANMTPTSESLNLISYLITSHPGVTNNELQQLLEQEGKKLNDESVRHLTHVLEKSVAVKVRKEGYIKRFFPKDNPDQPK